MRSYEDLTDTEIAQILGCTAGAVRSLATRAMPDMRGPSKESSADGTPAGAGGREGS